MLLLNSVQATPARRRLLTVACKGEGDSDADALPARDAGAGEARLVSAGEAGALFSERSAPQQRRP